MSPQIFLARSEEQRRFREVLSNLPYRSGKDSAFVFLFYGDAGMGKTTLTKHLLEIAEREEPFADGFNTLLINWEIERGNYAGLRVGHDYVEPETVFKVMFDCFRRRGWDSHFKEYLNTISAIETVQAKIEKELKPKPDSKLDPQLSRLGTKGLMIAARAAVPVVGAIPSELTEGVEREVQEIVQAGGSKLLTLARDFVQSTLTKKDEFALFTEPSIQMARALGVGIASLAKPKPLVIFLDTYEITDRPACDYALRETIKASGGRVIWVIAGRKNIADSSSHLRGYKRDFSEDEVLYAKSLSEFNARDIRDYFRQAVSKKNLPSRDEAEAIAEFTHGIPYAIDLVAQMRKQDVTLQQIIAPVTETKGEHDPHRRIVNELSDRFLMHCVDKDAADRQAIHVLALLRRPDVAVLRAMLNEPDLIGRLQVLRERYGFVLAEEGVLNDKLSAFLRERLLLSPAWRNDAALQAANDRAIVFLQLQASGLDSEFSDLADRAKDEAAAETVSDLAHHLFWKSEEDGWKYLIPRFVEGLQYNLALALGLVEIAVPFHRTFLKDGQRRLTMLATGLSDYAKASDVANMLDELDTLTKRKWLEGDGVDERKASLLLKRGEWLYRQERYKDALQRYLDAERKLPASAVQLRKYLAEALRTVGWRFIVDRQQVALSSLEGEDALLKAVALDPEDGDSLVGLGAAEYGLKKYGDAERHLKAGIELIEEEERSYALNWLGNVYSKQGNYAAANAIYQRAIQLNPNDAIVYNNLGNLLVDLKRYEEAEQAYRHAIEVDPNLAKAYNNLGSLLDDLKRYEEAERVYRHAIEVDPKYAAAYNNLGSLLDDLKRYEEAERVYRHAIEVDPKYAAAYNNLGSLLDDLKRYEEAEQAYRHAIEVDPNLAKAYNNLGSLLDDLKRYEEAERVYRHAIEVDPKYAAAYNNLGSLLDDLKRYEEAEQAYRHAIEVDPKYAAAYNNLGSLLVDLKRYEEAERVYRHAIEVDPNLAKAYYNLGSLLDDLKRYEEAERVYRHAIEVDPKYAAAYNNLGILLKDLKRYEEAEQAYRHAIEVDPNDATAYNNLGILLKDLKRYEEAEQAYRHAIEVDPNDATAYNNLGILLKDLKRYEEAEQAYRHAIEVDPNLAKAYYNLGILLKDLKRYEEAEQAYRHAIEVDPNLAKAYYNLGSLLVDLKRYEEAERVYRHAIEVDPNLAKAYYNLGSLLVDLKRYEEAERVYRHAIEVDPKYAAAYNNLGILLKDLKRYEEAEQAYRHAIEVDPNLAKAYYNLGILLKDLKRYEEAEQAYRHAIQLNPNDATAYNNLGILLKDLKRYEEAEQAYRHAIEVDPNLAKAYNNLGSLLDDLKRYEEAERVYRHAIEVDPKYAAAYYNLGSLLVDLKRYEEAERVYRHAIEVDPKYAAAYNNLGILLKDLKRYEEAEQAYRHAIEVDPKYAAAYNNLGILLKDLKRYEEAEQAYRHAIEVDPNLAKAYNNLGILLKDLKRYEEAEQAYRHAIEVDPNLAKAYYNLGSLLVDLKRYEEAEQVYRRGLTISPSDTDILNNLVILLRITRRGREALPLLETYAGLAPSDFIPSLALACIHKELGDEPAFALYAAQARAQIPVDDRYSLACLESICGNAGIALDHLRSAAAQPGFDCDWVQQDPDLQWIREVEHRLRFADAISELCG